MNISSLFALYGHYLNSHEGAGDKIARYAALGVTALSAEKVVTATHGMIDDVYMADAVPTTALAAVLSITAISVRAFNNRISRQYGMT